MRKREFYVIPIRPHPQLEFDNPVSQVTPVVTVEEGAKTEHSRDVKESVSFVKLIKGIKRPTQRTSDIS